MPKNKKKDKPATLPKNRKKMKNPDQVISDITEETIILKGIVSRFSNPVKSKEDNF